MGDSNRFSEAARLFATNWKVVEAMRTAYDSSVDDFFNEWRDAVKEAIDNRQQYLDEAVVFHEKITAKYRYWWLATAGVGKDKYVHLWYETRNPELLVPGKITLNVGAEKLTGAEAAAVRSAANHPELKPLCKPGTGTSWWILRMDFEFGGADPLEVLREPAALVLMEAERVMAKLRREQEESALQDAE